MVSRELKEIIRLKGEIAKLKKELAEEERSHSCTIDHRDKHEGRINAICDALGLSEQECAWTSHNDPSERAIEAIERLFEKVGSWT